MAKLSRPFGQVDPEEELREFQRREALRINLPQGFFSLSEHLFIFFFHS